MANCAIQCPINHVGVNVLRYRANRAPAGRKIRKPMTEKSACATTKRWEGVNGMSLVGEFEPLGVVFGVVVDSDLVRSKES